MSDSDFELKGFLAKGVRKPGRYYTFDEWYELSYHVILGERHEIRDANGDPLFHETQVEQNQIHQRADSRYEGSNRYDLDDFGYDGPGEHDGEGFLW
jgi:hypothetical protein